MLSVLCFGANLVCAQSTRVRGFVRAADTDEPLPMANVLLEGTQIGTSTDFDGFFSLETRDTASVLRVAYMGYEPFVSRISCGAFSELNIRLQPLEFSVEQINVRPGANPALPLMARVAAAKNRHNAENFPSYQCKVYTKMEIDLMNVDSTKLPKKMREQWAFAFDNIDTLATTGKAYLPFMISESSSQSYYRQSPRLTREVMLASRISGIKNDYSLAQFTGQMHANVNLYENYLSLFNVTFPSPLLDHGTTFYHYFLIDSLRFDGRQTYRVRFHPKRLSMPVLDGELLIDSASCAIRSAHVTMPKGVNVNWLHYLAMNVENRPMNDSIWFKQSDRLEADVTLLNSDSSSLMSIGGRRDIAYSEFAYGAPIPPEVQRMSSNVVLRDDVLKTNENYWDSVRPQPLTDHERGIYNMMDSIQHTPIYRVMDVLTNALFGGYYEFKKFEIGPYYKLFSYNKLEGFRCQLGIRTLPEWNHKVRLSAYAAYGVRDTVPKGGVGVEYMLSRQPIRKLSLSYHYDAMQLGTGQNALTQGNMFGSLLARHGGSDKLNMAHDAVLNFLYEVREGIELSAEARVLHLQATPFVPLQTPDSLNWASTGAAMLSVGGRFAHNEMSMYQPFDKYHLYTDFPIVSFVVTGGLKGLLPHDGAFLRMEAQVDYSFDIPPIGRSHIVLGGGKIFGQVPFPFLKIHEGNGSYLYSQYAFSCMDYYEFASDMWYNIFYEHHFKGFFLSKIPLIKRLHWREVAVVRLAHGTLSAKNNGMAGQHSAPLIFPGNMSSLQTPYVEAGLGIENIFRIFRIDAIWRLNHLDAPRAQHFVLNIGAKLSF